MQRFWEMVLGLKDGFLSSEGEFSVHFNPRWWFQESLGAGLWNFLLIAAGVALVVYVYRRDGHSRRVRLSLGAVRVVLLAFILAMLNHPVLRLSQSRTEASVVAVVLDESKSLGVKDGGLDPTAPPITRMAAMTDLLTGQELKLLKDLNKHHNLRFCRFSKDASAMAAAAQNELIPTPRAAATQPITPAGQKLAALLAALQPQGQATRIVNSLRSVLDDLQGQRLAGVVLLSDGRSAPAEDITTAATELKNYGVRIYSVPLGSDKAPKDLAIEAVTVQPDAFEGDIVYLTARVSAAGYAPGQRVRVVARNKATNEPLKRSDGKPNEELIEIKGEDAQVVELPFKPDKKGTLDVVVEVEPPMGAKVEEESDRDNNRRLVQVAVLDAKITVLYVDGYPRWEYRYLVREMMRDKTVLISSLLASADQGFVQEGTRPITRFPENMQELLEYDAVVFGDVDPRQFTNNQLLMVNDFVAKKGGGFGMVAGPRWSPVKFRGTPLEAVLPVNINDVEEPRQENITVGFRPTITREGEASSIFRFFADRSINEKYVKEDLQPLFWYCRGTRVKAGVGEVLAEHPSDMGKDGRKAPILVVGRFGAGRTLFSAIDDSWRWRFYTGEQVFDSYWLQQFRYLSRSKKLGERKFMLSLDRPLYDLGSQLKLTCRILDPERARQLPNQISVEVYDEKNKQVDRHNLTRSEGDPEMFEANWMTDTIGKFSLRVNGLDPGGAPVERPFEVLEPRLEMIKPNVDLRMLSRLADSTGGKVVAYKDARRVLPTELTSMAKVVPLETNEPLWDAPLAMLIFVLLITAEWVLRKVFGML